MFNILTGEIKDHPLEHRYLDSIWHRSRKQLMLIMAVGMIATLFMMFANTQDARIDHVVLPLLIVRSLEFLGYSLVLGLALSQTKPSRIAEAIVIAQLACLLSNGTNYVLAYAPFLPEENTTTMPFMVLILFLYYTVVPGKANYHIGIGVLSTFSYMGFAVYIFEDPANILMHIIIQFSFVNLLGIAYSRNINRLQRQDFLNTERIEQEVSQRKEAEQLAIFARQAAENASNEKSKFIAVAGHDLRQPLHALGLWIDTLQARIQDKNYADIDKIVQRTMVAKDGLDSLLDRLLHISHLDAGITDIKLEAISMSDFLQETKRRFSSAAERRGIILSITDSSAIVECDPILLIRITDNLVDNAIKYGNENGKVIIGVRRQKDFVRLQVWNSGQGIPEAELGQIFNEFHKVDRSQDSPIRGLGLGLSIVKRLVDLLDLKIDVYSQPERFTCFQLILPRSKKRPVTHRVQIPKFEPLDLNVLVIDDDEEVLAAMQSVLSRWGIAVETCCERFQAFDLVNNKVPDLILTDRQLAGGENGISLVTELIHKFSLDIPVIVMSGDTTQKGIQEAVNSGFEVLSKPVKPAKLRMLINQLVSE